MLHTIHNSPFASNDLESCLRVVRAGDDLLLYEDAVIAALVDSEWADKFSGLSRLGIVISVLRPDLEARGVPTGRLVDSVETTDYAGFVGLVEKHKVTQAW
jgi:tRNA 2-thiouridine synthesizing protein B